MTRAFHGEGLIVRLIITLVGAFVIALGAIGTAQGDPFNEGSLTVTLYNCTGPAGTPSTMEGTRMPNGSNPCTFSMAPAPSCERASTTPCSTF